MFIHNFDHRQYVKVGDLDHLIQVMRYEIMNRYEQDEDGCFCQADGTKGFTAEDSAVLEALADVMTRVMEEKLDLCHTEGEIDEVFARVGREFYADKYIVLMRYTGEDGDKGEIYFKSFCTHPLVVKMREEGMSEEEIWKALEEETGEPAFVSAAWDAQYFESYADAEAVSKHINDNYEIVTEVSPAFLVDDVFMQDEEKLDRVIKALFGDNGKDGEEKE